MSAISGTAASLSYIKIVFRGVRKTLVLLPMTKPGTIRKLLRSVYHLKEDVAALYDPRHDTIIPLLLVLSAPSAFSSIYGLVTEKSGIRQFEEKQEKTYSSKKRASSEEIHGAFYNSPKLQERPTTRGGQRADYSERYRATVGHSLVAIERFFT